jgi:hypothetical protein
MRRIAVAAGAVILVVCMIGGGLAVASRRSGIVRRHVLSLAVHLVNEGASDVGASGESPGDTFFAQSELQNFDLTKQLGRYTSACVLENVDTRLNHCTATVSLSNGKVELSGRFPFSDTLQAFRLAVVGGSGAYENVVGQATIMFGCDACPPDSHDVDTLTLDLIPSFEHP